LLRVISRHLYITVYWNKDFKDGVIMSSEKKHPVFIPFSLIHSARKIIPLNSHNAMLFVDMEPASNEGASKIDDQAV